MFQLPQLSTPLTAGIRTTEGILSAIVTSLISICTIVDPHALPKKEAAILVAATAVLYGVQRTLLKVVAVQKGLGIAAPIDNVQLDHILGAVGAQAESVSQLVDQHATLVKGVEGLAKNGLTKQSIDDLMKKLEEFANAPMVVSAAPAVGETTPGPVHDDPAMTAAVALSNAEEAGEQPSAEAAEEQLQAANPAPPQLAGGVAHSDGPPPNSPLPGQSDPPTTPAPETSA